MSQRRYRAAIVGLGRIGSTFDEEQRRYSRWRPPHAHAACCRAADRIDLVAGADPYPSQRDAFARKWDLDSGRVYADFREMLAREQPDIVSNCTSARPRAAIMRDLLQGGSSVKAVWTEKPTRWWTSPTACGRSCVSPPAGRPMASTT